MLKTIRVSDIGEEFFASRTSEVTTDMVRNIIDNVRKWGDESLFEYSASFDKIAPSTLRIADEDIREAAVQVKQEKPELYAALIHSRDLALRFNALQARCFTNFEIELAPGLFTGQKTIPIERAGIYIPAGRFPLLSSVIMCLAPAIAAGVKEIVLCTPPRRYSDTERPWADPSILATMALCSEKAPDCTIKSSPWEVPRPSPPWLTAPKALKNAT